MNKCLIAIAITLSLCSLPAITFASAWYECKVTADISKTQIINLYKAKILKAVYTNGFGETGMSCMTGSIGKTVEVKIEGKVATGKNKILEFHSYSAMGPQGPVSSETWTYIEEP